MSPTLQPVQRNKVVISQKRRRQHSYYCNAVQKATKERKERQEKERQELNQILSNVSWIKRDKIYMEIYGKSLLLDNDKRLLKEFVANNF